MLIGISVTSVTSKRSCALDDGPSVKESVRQNGEQVRENRFETLDSVDSAIFDKSLNNVFLLVASCFCSKMNTGVRV
jgi:hypothetical protein